MIGGAPPVSIAIRAYRRRWLAEAIASVLGQTHRALELVIYDDAGDLEDVATAFGDSRLRYYRARERLNVAGRYKAAIALCRGRYVGLLDDDDRYEPEFVERLMATLEAHPRAVAAVSRIVWDVGGRLLTPADSRPSGTQPDAAEAFVDCRWGVTPSAALLRRSALLEGERQHPMPDDVWPDVFVNVRAAVAGWQFVLADAALVVKRWHPDQLSRRAGLSAHHRTVVTLRQFPDGNSELGRFRRRQLARGHIRRAVWRLLEGDRLGACSDLHCAEGSDPREWRWRRKMIVAVAFLPVAGRCPRRLRLALASLRTRHRRPPGTRPSRAAISPRSPGPGRAAASRSAAG